MDSHLQESWVPSHFGKGKDNTTCPNFIPFFLLPPALDAEYDAVGSEMSLWSVGVTVPAYGITDTVMDDWKEGRSSLQKGEQAKNRFPLSSQKHFLQHKSLSEQTGLTYIIYICIYMHTALCGQI